MSYRTDVRYLNVIFEIPHSCMVRDDRLLKSGNSGSIVIGQFLSICFNLQS